MGGSSIAKMCDVKQGFNFDRDAQRPMGYLTKLKIGDKDVVADMEIVEPLNEGKLKVSAVLASADWSSSKTDPVSFYGRVSIKNKQALKQMVLGTMTNIDVLFNFEVYEYDPDAKDYYKSFFSNADLKGQIQKLGGGDLDLSIENDKAYEVETPENYELSIGIVPKDIAQELHVAVSKTGKIVKQWGIAQS